MNDNSKKTLQQWLKWQENCHHTEIDLGLTRVREVIRILLPDCFVSSSSGITQKFPFKIITIAGTNGKGSSVAMLEGILTQAGYHVGSYTSPHLLRYNERIKINQKEISDELICQSFARIDRARGEISLSYFEFATLAAIDIFCQEMTSNDNKKKVCDVVILEVGLGGRLDAVNVIDPDVALVTTVDIDHQDWLGCDRNTIALEKAGIFRHDKPAVYGDTDMPSSITDKVSREHLEFYQYSKDYNFQVVGDHWNWLITDKSKQFKARNNCILPLLVGNIQLKNAANVLMVLELLKDFLVISQDDINQGLLSISLSGRFQILSNEVEHFSIILDVAHNEQAARTLKNSIAEYRLKKNIVTNKLHVIIGMLQDKEVEKVLFIFKDVVSSWRIIDLETPRAMPANNIKQILTKNSSQFAAKENNIKTFSDFNEAYQDYREYNGSVEEFLKSRQQEEKSHQLGNSHQHEQNSILLVFGSFHTVSDALTLLNSAPNLSVN